MKKITSLILALILVFSTVSAADLPAFFTETPTNYTADYSVAMTIENTDNLLALLRELEMPEEVENYVDLKSLLESLLSTGVKMKLQADMSPDFRKVKLAVTSDTKYEVVVNSNLEIGAKAKLGMWIDMDLKAQTPVFKVIYSAPMLNKYMVIDLFEMIPDDESKAVVLEYFNLLFSKDFIDSIIEFTSELYAKYSEITVSGATCTVKITNDGLIGMAKEFIPFISETMTELFSVMEGTDMYEDFVILEDEEQDLSFLDGLKLLGKDGITYKYSLLSGRISSADMTADISIDVESMYSDATGEEWPYESEGKIDMTAKTSVRMSKYNATAVKFPELTKDNSFNLADSIAAADDDGYTEEYIPEYPHFYVWANAKELPVVNGEYYVPLRACLENAYDETVTLAYNNGVVTATSEHFPGFKTIKLTKDSAIAYTDGKQISVSKVIIKDGTTYVGRSFFEKIYGWELSGIVHHILESQYEISFYTENY